jgi:signal transduction histidine kinase
VIKKGLINNLRYYLETLTISIILFIIVVVTRSELPETLIVQEFALISFITATYLGFRLPLSTKSKYMAIFEEFLKGGLLSLLLFITAIIIYQLANNPIFFGETRYTQVFSLVMILSSAPGYYAWKIFIWLWKKWQYLRSTHFQWNLTHNFVVVIISALIFFLGINLIFALLDIYPYNTSNEYSSLLAQIFQEIIQVIFPHLMIFIVLALISLLVTAPILILFSHLSTRKLTKRLIDLTEVTKTLTQGDLSVRAQVEGLDEVAQLQTAFNQMTENLQKTTLALQIERDKVSSLLKNQKEMTATISHELKTPVATLSAYLENNLNKDQELPYPLRQDLEIMFHETQKLRTMINDLFTLVQTENNQLNLNFQNINLSDALPKWLNPIKQLAWKNQRVEISITTSETLPSVLIDPVRTEQVILNLVFNALRHTPPGGLIQINAEEKADFVRVHVFDTGEGIPDEELEFIWDRYYRGKNNHHRGSGLGLALVKDLVTAMQGTVGVESKIEEGSHFWFDLMIVSNN